MSTPSARTAKLAGVLLMMGACWAAPPADGAWSMHPYEREFYGVPAVVELDGQLCLPNGGSSRDGGEIVLSMPPLSLPQSYVMAILLRERMGMTVKMANPMGSNANQLLQLWYLKGCPMDDPLFNETSGLYGKYSDLCYQFPTPQISVMALDNGGDLMLTGGSVNLEAYGQGRGVSMAKYPDKQTRMGL